MGLLYILAVVAGIGFLIFVHEFGHFLLAKLNGVRVDLFSLGFGPVLCSYRKGLGLQTGSSAKRVETMQRKLKELRMTEGTGVPQEDPRALDERLKRLGQTEYRLSLIPLGGFVKMAGEPLGEERTGAPDELTSKKPGQRFLIFVAGTAMNFIVAFPICMLAFFIGRSLSEPRLSRIPAPDSAEWAAGLTVGDRIVSVNGVEVNHLEAYKKEILRAENGKPIPVVVERGDPAQRVTLELVPRGSDAISVSPPTNVIDTVKAGSPAEAAGLRSGDVIVEIDGRRILDFNAINRAVMPSAGKPLPFKVLRPETGETLDVTVTPVTNPGTSRPRLVNEMELKATPRITKLHPLSCGREFLEPGDLILEINGKPMASNRDIIRAIRALPGKVATFKVLRAGAELVSHFTVRRSALGTGTIEALVGGSGGVPVLGPIPPGSPLEQAGAKEGDRILTFDGWDNYSVAEIEQSIRESFSKTASFTIARAEGGPLEIDLPLTKGPDGKNTAPLKLVEAYPRLIEIPESWPLYAAGVRTGDRVLRLDVDRDGTMERCENLHDLVRAAASDKPLQIVVEREGKELPPITATPGPIPYGEIQIGLRPRTVFHRYPKWQALVLGAREVIDISHLTFQILGKILQGKEKASGMSGPIGIFSVSYSMVRQGAGNFLWLLGLISVSLAIFNLFPIPILDGGHILFLIIEKIKGSPVSEKTMIIAQYVGLILIVALFVYVTKNDIMRHVFGQY